METKSTTEYGTKEPQKKDYLDDYLAEVLELTDKLIIEETYPLAGFFHLFYGENAPKSLILASDSYHYYLYLQTLIGKMFLLNSIEKKEYDPQKNKLKMIWPWEAAEEFHIDQYMSIDREVFNQVKEAGLDTLPEFPDEITKTCQKIEIIALYGPDSWLVKEKDGTLHIFGSGNVDAFTYKHSDWSFSAALMAIDWYYESKAGIRVILHDGIEQLWDEMFFGYDEEIEELVLPKTLKEIIPFIGGNIRKITVPESIRHIDQLDFVCEYTDPYEKIFYAVKDLALPADIILEDELFLMFAPCEYLETIRLYGTEPITDLEMWYQSNFFHTKLMLLYPSAWDKEKEGSYAEHILSFVRSRNPVFPEPGESREIGTPWEEKDYAALRERIRPY